MSRAKRLREELIAKLGEALASARAAHAAAIEGSTHPEARAENDKDTRGLEQSYLARGVAQRVAEIENGIAEVTHVALPIAGDRIIVGAVVGVDEDDEARTYFLMPAGGGTVLASSVQVVTPSSPLGRALLGKRVDDEIELALAGKVRALAITRVE